MPEEVEVVLGILELQVLQEQVVVQLEKQDLQPHLQLEIMQQLILEVVEVE
tara:strand:+ start:142 stop:294 length:153 start_codon:yes stop_codon:yes gene_type:complete